MLSLVSRQDALASGNVRYFTGEMCPKGHLAERYVSNFKCCGCAREHEVDRFHRNPRRVPGRKLRRQEELAGRPRPSCCETCGREGKIVFDHDHATGEFRGWICDLCNRMIGFAREDINTLRALTNYLETRSV